MQTINFKDFPTGNEAGQFIINIFWLEHLLNLFYQDFIGEVWIEIQDTLMNHKKTIENTVYGIIGQEFDKKHLSPFLKGKLLLASTPKGNSNE